MGLFDNPEYFRANAIQEKQSSTAHDSLMIIESSPVNASRENRQESIKSSNELIAMKKYEEKMASTPLLCEKAIENSNNENEYKKSLLIVQIILTVIFGGLINQSISYILANSLIKFKLDDLNYKTDKINLFYRALVYLIYSVIGGLSALSYSFFLYIIWRPKKRSLYLVIAILLTQLVAFGCYFFFNWFFYSGIYFQKQENYPLIVSDSIINAMQLISMILVFIEISLIK